MTYDLPASLYSNFLHGKNAVNTSWANSQYVHVLSNVWTKRAGQSTINTLKQWQLSTCARFVRSQNSFVSMDEAATRGRTAQTICQSHKVSEITALSHSANVQAPALSRYVIASWKRVHGPS